MLSLLLLPPLSLPLLQRGSLPWDTAVCSCPPAALNVGSAELLLAHRLAPLSCCKCRYAGVGWFFSLLTTLSQRHYHHRWWSWSCLALPLSGMGEASSSFSQKPPL